MLDAHLTAAGYVESPRDGGLDRVLAAVDALLTAHGVEAARRLACPAEQRGLHERFDARTSAWAPSVLDGRLAGFRSTRLCRRPDDVDRAIRAAAVDGATWLFLGDGLDARLAHRAVLGAREAQLRVAAEPGAVDDELLATGAVATIEGLLGLLVDASLRTARPVDQVLALAETSDGWQARLDPVLASEVTVVPLLVRTRRRCLLDEAVQAPGMEALVSILPYHQHLLAMRTAGGLRFGRRHAAEHLGVPVLDRADRGRFTAGWDVVLSALQYLAEQGGHLAVGSGAPGLGLLPGLALHEELAAFAGAGVAVDKHFSTAAYQLQSTTVPKTTNALVQDGGHGGRP